MTAAPPTLIVKTLDIDSTKPIKFEPDTDLEDAVIQSDDESGNKRKQKCKLERKRKREEAHEEQVRLSELGCIFTNRLIVVARVSPMPN